LNFFKVFELSWKFEHLLVGVDEPLLLEVKTLLDENSCHGNKILIRTKVLILNLIVIVAEVVLWASDNTKVW